MGIHLKQLKEATSLRKSGEFLKALKILEELESILNIQERNVRISCLNELSHCLWQIGKSREATKWAQEALLMSQTDPPLLEEQAKAFNSLGITCWQLGNLEEAESYLKKTFEINKQLGLIGPMSHTLNNLGLVFWQKAELEKAEEYYKQSLSLKEELGDKIDIAYSLSNLGIVYRQSGRLDSAEECYKRSLAIFEELGNPQELASCFINLGTLYCQRGELDKGEDYHRRSYKIRNNLGNNQDIARSLSSLANVLWKRGKITEAKAYFKQCFDIKRTIGNQKDLADSIYLFLHLLLNQDDTIEFSSYLNELETLVQTSKHPVVEVEFLITDGLLKLKDHELATALDQAQKAKVLSEKLSHFELLIDANRFLLQIYLKLYSFEENEIHLTNFKNILRETASIAKEKRLHETYIESILLQAYLNQATYSFEQAIERFNVAETQAKELGLITLANLAISRLNTLKKQIKKLKQAQKVSPHAYEQTQLKEVMDYLKKVQVMGIVKE